MVQSLVTLGEHEDRVLTILKGKFGLRNKSEVINFVIDEYEKEFLEPELRPEYREELLKIDSAKFKKVVSIDDLRQEIEDV